jgi:hypothetical protein
MALTIPAGSTIAKDPHAINVYWFNWTAYLANLVSASAIATPTFLISGPDSALTQDQVTSVDSARQAQVRLSGGTPRAEYTLTSRIVTTGSPPETEDRSVKVLIENL